ncbi:MAG TPA: DedA family protein [Bryobacteraceae bacterium]|jgi:membrane protein DedA with SNARE-associated domain|nr:DedA family protein [Bryobacteraceae bacterium]
MESLLGWVTEYGAVSLFFCMMLGIIGLPIPDETLLVFSGYLIFKGRLEPVFTLTMAFLGSMAGITVSYFLGRIYGLKLIHKYGRLLHVTEERYLKVHNWFEHVGRWSLFFGYYIAGVRHFTAMVAGASGLEYPRFAAFAYTGALTWVTTFLALGYFVGERWESASEQIHHYVLAGGAAIGAMVALFLLWQWVAARKRS